MLCSADEQPVGEMPDVPARREITHEETIAVLVEQIGTLQDEVVRLQREVIAAQSQRDDFAAKVYHATRRGW